MQSSHEAGCSLRRVFGHLFCYGRVREPGGRALCLGSFTACSGLTWAGLRHPDLTVGMDVPPREASTALLLYLLVGFNPSHCFSCLYLSAQRVVTALSVFPHRDYADNDLDGGEVENASRSRSSPPIPSATSCLDSHFGQDQLAIESTGNCLLFCLPRGQLPSLRHQHRPSFAFLVLLLSSRCSSPCPLPVCSLPALSQTPALGSVVEVKEGCLSLR